MAKKVLKIALIVFIVIVICSIVALCLLIHGCHDFMKTMESYDIQSPLDGKTTDERVIMTLEKVYPNTKFHTVKEYDHNEDYGVYADENGLEFKAFWITYNSSLHFACYNTYLEEFLYQNGFREKAKAIADKYGFSLRYDEANHALTVVMPLESLNENLEELSMYYGKALKEILNCVEIPKVIFPDMTMSTGEVNYYSISKLYTIGYKIENKTYGELDVDGFIRFGDKDKDVEEISKGVYDNLQEAAEYLNELESEKGNAE